MDIRIDVLWSLHGIHDESEEWTLYVNHIPMYESKQIRDVFYRTPRKKLSLSAHHRILGLTRILVREVAALLPPVGSVQDSGREFPLTGRLRHLAHYPRGRWIDQIHDEAVLEWTRPRLIGPDSYDTETGEIEIATLSEAAREAVARLDALAVETAYRRHGADLASRIDIPEFELPPAEKVRVFIAYRRSHFEEAVRLHSILQKYANGVAFEPYLDRHDMDMGDFMKNIRAAIDVSDAFLPIVSDDYAEVGSVGREEYSYAVHKAERRGLDAFFAPIFIGNPLHEVAAELKRQHGLFVGNREDIEPTNGELRRFLGDILGTVMAARPGATDT